MDLDGFAVSQRAQGLSPTTITAYHRELLRFQSFLKSRHLRITQVTTPVVMEYIGEHFRDPRLQQAAVSRALAALSSFFQYLRLIRGCKQQNPVTPVRRPTRKQPKSTSVDPEKVDALLTQVTDVRDSAILHLLFSSGLRLASVVALNKDSISVETTEVAPGVDRVLGVGRVVTKGNVESEFLVDSRTLEKLKQYLAARGSDSNPALFLSNRGDRISARAVEHMVRRSGRHVGIPNLHPHAARHTLASTLYAHGVDLLEISYLLAHRSPATTARNYIKPCPQRIRAEYFASMEVLRSGQDPGTRAAFTATEPADLQTKATS